MPSSLPTHIGYIVDGNRRWAKQRGLSASEGHAAGYEVVKTIIVDTIKRGVPYVSAYIFSTENWQRSPIEVNFLMKLIVRVLTDDLHIFIENNIRLRIAGSKKRLTKGVLRAIEEAEQQTKHLTGGQAIICLNYGGHQELADAFEAMRDHVGDQVITPDVIEKFLYTPDVPACDLIVRTSGEQRLSGYMLWRSPYSELLFLKKHWPDMTTKDVSSILKEYERRERRHGS